MEFLDEINNIANREQLWIGDAQELPGPIKGKLPVDPPTYKSKFTWIIDPGHGPATVGKRSPKWPDGSQLLEWEFNHDIADRLCRMLDEVRISYVRTVKPTRSLGNALDLRCEIANAVEGPAYFVSIHANAFSDERVNGTETFHYPGSVRGERLATVFHRRLQPALNRTDRGVKAANFQVLREITHPGCLVECLFMTNRIDCNLLMNDRVRNTIAESLFNAILDMET